MNFSCFVLILLSLVFEKELYYILSWLARYNIAYSFILIDLISFKLYNSFEALEVQKLLSL